MQGASPLASPGLNPGGTGAGGEPRALRGACLPCRRPALPLWYPAGGVSALSPSYPSFSFVFAPIPPTPFPSGKGGDLRLFYARGFAPCIPGAEPGGTGSTCPGGEDHLKRRRRLRRIVPSPPVPPLLGCRRCSRESLSCHFGGEPRISAAGTYMASSVSAASGLMPGCRGRSPRRNKLKISPFPPGRGRGDILPLRGRGAGK